MQQRNWYESIIAWFAENHVAANLLMISLLVGGLWSALTIKKEIQPSIDPNQITVRVPYLGASPTEVEEAVLVKVEEAIQDIEGIDKITSFGREGSGTITIAVKQSYPAEEVLDEIKLRVDGISTFPSETEKPIITKTQWTQEVMWISVFGDVGERTLKEYAKIVRSELVQLPGVTRAEVVGDRDYEIGIEVSEQTLRKFSLTMSEVAQAVRFGSLDLPAGSIDSSTGDILLRTKGQAYTGTDFENIVVRTNPDGTRLMLSDIANVQDAFEERERYTLHNGKPAIAIRVLSVGDQSELAIAKTVRDYVNDKRANLPSGVGVAYWADISYYLKGRLDMMNKNLLSGALLVFLILALFLRLKLAFWVMVGLPVAFLGTLWLMRIPEVSINMLSLFGFILVLGIVVDDAIIIGESVYTKIRKDGHSTKNVVDGTMEVAVPATFGVLTTVAAFMPILLISGIFGQFFSAIGWVVILALIFSLVESKLILPAHLAHMKIKPVEEEKQTWLYRIQRRFAEGLQNFGNNRYVPWVRAAIKNRYLTVSLFVSALVLSLSLLFGGVLRVVAFPDLAGDFIQVNIEMNEGSPASTTHRALDRLQATLVEVDEELSSEQGAAAGSVVNTTFIWSGRDTAGTLLVELVKDESALVSAKEVERRWREKIGEIAGAKTLSFSSAGGPGGGPSVAFNLVGSDLPKLQAAAAELASKIRSYDGVFDIRNSYEGGNREIKLNIKPEAESLGLSLNDLARQVRQAFFGEEVQRIQRGKDEVKVMVRYPKDERDSIGYLENMRIRTPTGDEVPFDTVAEVEFSSSPTVIRRFNRERAISVSAEVDKDVAEPGKIASDIRSEYLPELLARYPGVNTRLDGATEDEQQLYSDLLAGFAFAVFLIYALMAIPLRSYFQPLLIMSVVPFGIIGALFGHLVMGLDVSMLSMFGIIALSGVVVNDSLILIDFVNRARRKGAPIYDAVVNAGRSRFRAILLTSLTTFLGLAPIVFFETSLQAQIVIPMAASLAFGIVFSTVNTLFMIPALYMIGEDFKGWLRRQRDRMMGRPIEDRRDLQTSSQ